MRKDVFVINEVHLRLVGIIIGFPIVVSANHLCGGVGLAVDVHFLHAVRYVCDLYGIPVSEAYAAGDANNDFSMLSAAGNSIAMINGSDEVKAISSIITTKDAAVPVLPGRPLRLPTLYEGLRPDAKGCPRHK